MGIYQWTSDKDKYLKDNYHTKTNQELANTLGTDKYTILRRARKLGISPKAYGSRQPEHYYQWTEQQDRFLIDNFKTKSNQWLSDNMPDIEPGKTVSVQAIMRRMKKLGISRKATSPSYHSWTEEEVEKLELGIYTGQSLTALAKSLSISYSSVIRKARLLGIF